MAHTRRTSRDRALRRLRIGSAAACAALLVCLTAGCLEVQDELVIQADGSGTVLIRTTMDSQTQMLTSGMAMGREGKATYPPTNEQEARNFFAGSSFDIIAAAEDGENGARVQTIRVAFQDINDLMKTGYGEAHGLQVVRDGGKLTVKAVSGMAGATAVEDLPADEMPMGPSMASDELKKSAQRLKVSFKVTLPAAVTADGAAVEGNSATWTIDRAALGDKAKTAEALQAVMTASCPDAGVQFTPQSPLRMKLSTFEQLKEGPLAEAPKSVDEAKVKAAVKVVPLKLSVTRTFDLAGVGYSQNEAELHMVAVVSREFAPQRWGEPKLVAALDEKGRSLAPGGDRFGFSSGMRYSGMMGGEAETDESVKHFVFPLRVPPAESRVVKSVKGEVALLYPGVGHIAKIADAVTPGDIQDDMSMMYMADEQALPSKALESLEVKLSRGGAGRQYGILMMMFTVESRNAAVEDIQVFDKSGKPQPTMVIDMEPMGEQGMVRMAVFGQPEAPLSLGVLLSGGGARVDVPFDLKDLPLTPNEMPSAEPAPATSATN